MKTLREHVHDWADRAVCQLLDTFWSNIAGCAGPKEKEAVLGYLRNGMNLLQETCKTLDQFSEEIVMAARKPIKTTDCPPKCGDEFSCSVCGMTLEITVDCNCRLAWPTFGCCGLPMGKEEAP
jgi:hypothetical protein